MTLLIPVAPGELIDKITILRLKSRRIADPAKLGHVIGELQLLEAVLTREVPSTTPMDQLMAELQDVNAELWQIEDDIRDCERAGDFGPRFIALARSVYVTNDRRAALKRSINNALGSAIVEEKSYRAY